ncbi:MAG TPA: DNA polymerase III subunit alpha [Ornithinimicrobium sp.]|uniref:DNA polymerase III subunit alpha n=1 Tax=Ornithinimicrobium sp. TaxID=1977084 RepID=UPI002B496673|nr:DNA polymerase III subunit alpha [Ornithinimicrobium sp.]HKJ12111.1 DNA polymerase III subunit alpha [Ornithinimicrobium sp.]
MSGSAGADFAHLHVASSYSMRYGASSPEALVRRAAELGQSSVALTDRDGAYAAVRFVRAATEAGVHPVLGVDLALGEPATASGPGAARRSSPTPSRAHPLKGGPSRADREPRVTVLARGQQAGLGPGLGWSRLCRLVTHTHLAGDRGAPRLTVERLAAAAVPSAGTAPLVVLLGPDSDVGRAVLSRRHAHAEALLQRWRQSLPPGSLRVEVVVHGGPAHTSGSLTHAARMWMLAREHAVPVVLTAAVRHAEVSGARVVDVLDAARRMVPLQERHLDRVSTAGHLADTPTMLATADRLAAAMGHHRVRGGDLVAATLELAGQCRQDARSDLGIGSVQLPEPEVLGVSGLGQAQQVLTERCRAAVHHRYPPASGGLLHQVQERLTRELEVISGLGYPTYFLTVAQVCDLIREQGVRVAARGSGAGSLVCYLLGISGVDPIRHDLLMERFCSPLRAELPDIDIDVESARRTEIYERILEHFGSERVTCVSMMETYRVRHAIRDVAATLGMPPAEIDLLAKAFPHIRARDAGAAIRDLPELRRLGLDEPAMRMMFELVESLDGLPRHVAMHPCGVILSHAGLLDRTPVEASWLGFPMSQFDKDDVEAMGFLKLDVLGIRMQSAMAHAVAEVERVEGRRVDLDDQRQVPHDDPSTFALIQSTRTLGCFQIESPGQRELVGKFAPETFEDVIIDISLFRPGPVKSDMIRPFLQARQGWAEPEYLHRSLVPALASTYGVVVFHEQVLRIVAETTGVSLAQADEVRRAMGSTVGREQVEHWWRPAARARGYSAEEMERIWQVLAAFASFGFCKAHAAAFALPTYQSAWLKAHHTAAFLAGVLTHDPGMYPKRLILDEARNMGVHVLGLDVNVSGSTYRVEKVAPEAQGPEPLEPGADRVEQEMARITRAAGCAGIRMSLAEVKGITDAEVERIVAGQPYTSVTDFWRRAAVSRPVVERLVMVGGFDSVHRLGEELTRRDLLLTVRELDRWSGARPARSASVTGRPGGDSAGGAGVVAARTRAQARGARSWHPRPPVSTQLTLDLDNEPRALAASGLPTMTTHEETMAELDVLGMDVSGHVTSTYQPLLQALGVTAANRLLECRNGAQVLIAGAKVATQTPPVRSGRRVVFLTLDDGTGPSDATFFEDVQGPYAATVFHSWLLVVRGVLRRTGPRGRSVRAEAAWEMTQLDHVFRTEGIDAVWETMERSSRDAEQLTQPRAGTGEQRRVLVHASGFTQSPYADIGPPGSDRKLWHSSPGSSGR